MLWSFQVHILLQNFVLFHFYSVVDLSLNTLQLVGRIFFYYFGMFCFVCIVWLSTFLRLFCQYLWFISFRCVVRLVCSCLLRAFSFHWVPICFTFLSNFVCFIFLFGFLRGIHILLLTSFALALINLFTLVKLSIEICCKTLITFFNLYFEFFSILNFTDGNVAIFSLMIFFY